MIEQHQRPIFSTETNGHEPGNSDDACPVCGRLDATMKASSVTRSSRGRVVLDDGTTLAYESDLGSMLSPPPRPNVLPGGIVLAACVVGFLLLAIDLAIVAGLRAQTEVSIPETALNTATYLGIAWFGVLIPGVGVVRYIARREMAIRELPAWRDRVQRWSTFNYCSRDDIVFVPGEARYFPPEQMNSLYESAPATPAVLPIRQQEAEAQI